MSIGILRAIIRSHQDCVLLRIQRRQMDIRPSLTVGCELKKEEMLSVGQKHGPAWGTDACRRLLLADRSGWASARCGNAQQRGRGVRSKQNCAIRAPCTAARLGSICQSLDSAAAGVDDAELSLRKESQAAAIRRPEGKNSILGPGQRLGRSRIQGTHPKLGRSSGAARHKRQLGAIGRNRNAERIEIVLLRWQNADSQWFGGYRCAQNKSNRKRDGECC